MISQTASDLLGLLRDDPKSPELRRLALELISAGVVSFKAGC